ncbi:unnamed protein product [Rhizoctonia solani]|uniref:Zn(2)-C6 fungal-type domain-containing protein n=1 Tax=Rhizoctonia solani TaxID=456999 RepID=A0A8H3GCE8_9AGAM|nr:unnamed protein product [Rhizoctonia solani]
MSRFISKPGPPPTSCLTCRRRRKKCDMTRPSCKRCLRDGYECLGYEDRKSRARVHQKSTSLPTHSQAQSNLPTVPANAVKSETANSIVAGLLEDVRDRTSRNTGRAVRPSILGAAMLYGISGPMSLTDDKRVITNPSKEFDRLWPQDQSQSLVHPRHISHVKRDLDTTFNTDLASNGLMQVIEGFWQSIPPSIDGIEAMREDYFGHVITAYQIQRLSYRFTPPPPEISNSLTVKLTKSKRIVWVTYLAAKVFQVLHQDPLTQTATVVGHIGWVDKLEHKFTTTSRSNPSLNEVGERLMVHLELASLKFNLVDPTSGYSLLRNALPKFFQLAAADTNLLVEQPDGNLTISCPHVLRAPRFELRRFVLYEAVSAFLLGLPPLVEYGYDGECDSEHFGFEWTYGTPVTLIQVILQVNSWRAGSRVRLDDWQTLERRVTTWKSPYATLDGACANDSAGEGRAAVQEGWRHVALIYIYMGVCGASSHDSRVQTSVDRIFELGEAIGSSQANIHMLPHCVVAGVAARLEKHRIAVYEKLRSLKGTHIWLFPGTQFSEVLYHLWHGVGLGGAAVTWNDYVQSRCAVAPA